MILLYGESQLRRKFRSHVDRHFEYKVENRIKKLCTLFPHCPEHMET